MKSRSKKSRCTRPYNVENAPKRTCMTTEQLKILDPFYSKNDRPAWNDIELLAEALAIPAPKVLNWFNNRRAKEARLRQNSSLIPSPLSQCLWNTDVDSDGTADMTDSDDDGVEPESGDAQGGLNHEALYQEARACVATMAEMSPEEVDMQFIEQEIRAARACVLTMAKMTPEEVNAAFILSNLKRRIIVHPLQK